MGFEVDPFMHRNKRYTKVLCSYLSAQIKQKFFFTGRVNSSLLLLHAVLDLEALWT
jgi:hypothetical protein